MILGHIFTRRRASHGFDVVCTTERVHHTHNRFHHYRSHGLQVARKVVKLNNFKKLTCILAMLHRKSIKHVRLNFRKVTCITLIQFENVEFKSD